MRSGRHERWIGPIGALAGYLVLSLAVGMGLLDAVDAAVRTAARPDDVWGPAQMRGHLVVQELRPAHLLVPLLLVTAVVALMRRSLRPVALLAVVTAPVAIVTLATKYSLARPDPHATASGHGGSFPSGHTASVIIAVGVVVLLLRPDTRWGWLVPAAIGAGMGWALVVVAMHWASDVLGAALLGVAGLASARATGLGHWARGRPGRPGARTNPAAPEASVKDSFDPESVR